jgi:hypothetical protein
METIISILLLSIICAFIGFGFNKMQDPDMIFFWYKNLLNYIGHKSKFLHYLVKPLGICIICNTTWIGILSSYIILHPQKLLLFSMMSVGVCSAGIVIIIVNIFNRLQS